MQLFDYLSNKKAIYYILLLCFLIRVILVLTIDPLGDTVDGYDYHNSAISLLNGTGYPLHGSLPFVRPPLYPILLSIVYFFLPHETYLTARLVNVILDTAACFVFYKLILLIWNDNRTALLASLIYVFNPLYLFFDMRVRVEALFTLLVVAGIYFLVREYKRDFPSLLSIILIGAVFGLACLCRSNITSFVALVPIWFMWCARQKWRRGILISLGFILGCGLLISPWSIRNYYKYRETIFITDGFGFNFWISNTDLKLDDLNARNYQEYLAADAEVWKKTAQVESVIQGKSYKERDNYYFSLGKQYIQNNFSTWLWLNVLKFAEFWSPSARFDMQGWKAAITLPFGLLTLFGLLIYLKSFYERAFDINILLLFGILFFVATITGVLTWSSIRYRVPLVDAYLIPFGISWIKQKIYKEAEEVK